MFKLATSLLLLSAAGSSVLAHMEMTNPAPRRSKFNPSYKGDQIDYSMTSPLDSQWPYPCRGYGAGPSAATYQAGSSVGVDLDGGATHNGGHCQFSLSVDGGKTFVVMKTVMGNCMIASRHYDVPIPKSAPNGKAVFAWTWINKTGNREYYMNCADITIQGGNGKCISGPKNLVVNLPGYTTIPEFTSGGYDGSDLMNKRPIVSSCSDGSASDDDEVSPSASSKASSSTAQPKATTIKPASNGPYRKASQTSKATETQTTSKSGSSNTVSQSETEETSKCVAKCLGGSQFQVCGNGGATAFKKSCAPGTSCHMRGDVVSCS